MSELSERVQGIKGAILSVGEQLLAHHPTAGQMSAAEFDEFDSAMGQTLFDTLVELEPEATIFVGSKMHIGNQRRWIVRAVDGQTNFSAGRPYFAVSLACFDPEGGHEAWVFDPIHQQLFTVIDGIGRVNGLEFQPLSGTRLHEIIVGVDGFHQTTGEHDWYRLRTMISKGIRTRQMGCPNLQICEVASGQADGFFAPSLNIRDVVAGLLITQAAGVLVKVPGLDESWNIRRPCFVAQTSIADSLLDLWPDLEHLPSP